MHLIVEVPDDFNPETEEEQWAWQLGYEEGYKDGHTEASVENDSND